MKSSLPPGPDPSCLTSVPLDATALVPEPPAESPRSGSAMTGSTWSLNQESTIEKGTEASVASKDGESVVSPDIDLQALEDAVYSLADTPGGFDQDALDTLDRVLSQGEPVMGRPLRDEYLAEGRRTRRFRKDEGLSPRQP